MNLYDDFELLFILIAMVLIIGCFTGYAAYDAHLKHELEVAQLKCSKGN